MLKLLFQSELCYFHRNIIVFVLHRRLTSKQKELIVEFAETERHSGDTKIAGVTDKGEEIVPECIYVLFTR